jgi:hypothetical protein
MEIKRGETTNKTDVPMGRSDGSHIIVRAKKESEREES